MIRSVPYFFIVILIGLPCISLSAEKDKRYMTISGATLWSREPFRALGFDEYVIEQLGQVGEHILPHSVTACYVQQGVYKNLIHLRRDDTGEVVDKDGKPIAQAS
jgi:hypothetical protein